MQCLRERETYVSGQELCRRFGVSRTAVWKHIQNLRKEGYEIDSVSNKGYCLLSEPDLLIPEVVGPKIATKWAGKNLAFFEQTDSTNIRAKVLGEEGAPHGTLVIAERQSAGRGRRGRAWVSPAGESIYMTLLLKPDIAIANASMLTLVAAIAVACAVDKAMGGAYKCGIKWPNDIIIDGKKLCGILTEMTAEDGYINHIVIGMGINVNALHFAPEVEEVATSMRLAAGRRFVRADVIADTMTYFEEYYEMFVGTQDLSELTDTYNSMLINRGRQVRIVEQTGEELAIAEGITSTGGLIIVDAAGRRREIIAGEVSVRGVLGYV